MANYIKKTSPTYRCHHESEPNSSQPCFRYSLILVREAERAVVFKESHFWSLPQITKARSGAPTRIQQIHKNISGILGRKERHEKDMAHITAICLYRFTKDSRYSPKTSILPDKLLGRQSSLSLAKHPYNLSKR